MHRRTARDHMTRAWYEARAMRSLLVLSLLVLGACASCPRPVVHAATADERAAIDAVMDDWHDAAASSDEARYFGHLTEDAIFLGTDATERWNPQQFRDYAHPAFEAGRGWRMRSVRRDVIVRGDVAWLDEDLETVNLGPARGSAVLLRSEDGVWRIAHYDLAITVPNERFVEVRDLLRAPPPPPQEP
ncbi:Protein with SnoaL 3 domain, NTF 2 superfamily [Sandaracinus amylolyticus]|nr:Protein with SnoaL 3 domain, NTF 2 superfamily [Sandaracinus amylolyticus]